MPSSTSEKDDPLPSQPSNPYAKSSEFVSPLLKIEQCTRVVEAKLQALKTPRWVIQRVLTAIRKIPLAGDP